MDYYLLKYLLLVTWFFAICIVIIGAVIITQAFSLHTSLRNFCQIHRQIALSKRPLSSVSYQQLLLFILTLADVRQSS